MILLLPSRNKALNTLLHHGLLTSKIRTGRVWSTPIKQKILTEDSLLVYNYINMEHIIATINFFQQI